MKNHAQFKGVYNYLENRTGCKNYQNWFSSRKSMGMVKTTCQDYRMGGIFMNFRVKVEQSECFCKKRLWEVHTGGMGPNLGGGIPGRDILCQSYISISWKRLLSSQ